MASPIVAQLDPCQEDLEDLEFQADQPSQPHTRGSRRPQAIRSARARRNTYLGRLTYQ